MENQNLNKRKLEEDVEIDEEKIKKSEYYKEKGNEMYKKLMYDEALDLYFKSITLNPKDHRCYGNIGQILIHKSRYSEAREVLYAAIELNSNYAKAYYRLGLVEKQLKNYDEALRNFDKVLRLEPNNKATIKECDEIKKSFGINKLEMTTEQNTKSTLFDKVSSNDSTKCSIIKSSNSLKSSEKQSSEKQSSVKESKNNSHINSIKSSNKNLKNMNNLPKINIPVKLPDTQPKTSYQFNLVWREIKDNQMKIDYLTFVGAKNFLKLFQKNVEPDFLSELIVLFVSMDKKIVSEFLYSLTQINTFDFSLMFLSKKEKDTIKQLIGNLDQPIDTKLANLYKV